MYIRINFTDVDSEATKATYFLFMGIPNGTCLTSSNAFCLKSHSILEKVGRSALFWYLDETVLTNYYDGPECSINHLRSYPGVQEVTVLPIRQTYGEHVNYDDICALIESSYLDPIVG
jgi:hypothetical protein